MVQAITLVVLVLGTFTVGYLGYSRYLSRFVELDDDAETPAHKYEDGQEYVPSKKPVLLGHHYSSIAGGAPIVGPITAALAWGWLPAFLWVAIGNPLFGAVHDFMSLSSSMRHEGKSIGYIIGQYVGERGKSMILWFAFLTIILVIAVFALVIAIVFDAYPSAATASLVYIGLALLFGAYLYQFDLPFLPGTAVFVAAVFGGIWVGVNFPLAVAADVAPAMEGVDPIVLFGAGLPLPAVLGSANIGGWIVVVMLYGLVASVLPVWVLLQPRDFLTSSLLYAGVGGTLLAVVVGTALGAGGQLEIALPAYTGFMGNGFGPLFPLLFVTIACGTISGFHSLVSSGTTAKQLNKETDARPIGYGAMLGEGLLATVAIVTVAVYGFTDAGGGIGLALPNFAAGGGLILNVGFGIPETLAAPFMGLVLVSFLLTSTDTAIRLGRYMFEEIVGTPETAVEQTTTNRYVNVALQVTPAYLLVASGSWSDLWPLFGGANQTLAALALLVATVWLANWKDDKQLISTGGPMAIMFAITTTALLYKSLYELLYLRFIQGQWPGLDPGQAPTLITQFSTGLQIVLALVLVGLGLALAFMGVKNVSQARESGVVATDGGDPTDD
ncbi:carbon starvation CstA family protein [Salinirubrum litoreum]|uniref:Carbon starvation protein A n=1 Tax=Salinirubrum litoreum TaxID=1126234 RepID=A0ABD5R688_9EURY|nr:carbon starvation protein A [Salinirubrum litoreum]